MRKILGKRRPETNSLNELSEKGFEYSELYLTSEHLTDLEETIAQCKASDVSVEAVHTPHSSMDELEDFEKSSVLADELNAQLIFHSGAVHLPQFRTVLTECEFSSTPAFENQPGQSPYSIEKGILEQGLDLVLDVAHLYIGVGDEWTDYFEYFLTEYPEQIAVVHLCDSVPLNDGLAIGEGDMDYTGVWELLADYGGIITIEVPVGKQGGSRDVVVENLGVFVSE